MYQKGINQLPNPVLRCQTLQSLELINFKLIKRSFSSSTLTSLSLRYCTFTTGGRCYDVSAKFPNLKNLCLHRCRFGKFKVLKISGPNIIRVSINGIFAMGEGNSSEECKVELCAPNATYFCCDGNPFNFKTISLPALQHAFILPPSYPYEEVSDVEKIALLDLLQVISSAKYVTLSSYIVTVLIGVSGLEYQPSPFGKLKSLKLRGFYADRLSMLPEKVKSYLFPCPDTTIAENMRIEYLISGGSGGDIVERC
ncbi:hypothetical protein Tsubulata_051043 [Turnera subulata]|uniref:FBD domain-containing protein n=1 Tax=Turnera subulata TaxID=218843 RepID=A0A9Q0J6C7_9ROSI|nr:hypothetical protein Tsubulata_051043 [Turnera subulata]